MRWGTVVVRRKSRTHHRVAGGGVAGWVNGDEFVSAEKSYSRSFPRLCVDNPMDPFEYFPRENVRRRELERALDREADGWSPDRQELRRLLTILRLRYGRRRVFHVADVERVVRDLRNWDHVPATVLRFAPMTVERPHPPRVVIDLTCEESIGSS